MSQKDASATALGESSDETRLNVRFDLAEAMSDSSRLSCGQGERSSQHDVSVDLVVQAEGERKARTLPLTRSATSFEPPAKAAWASGDLKTMKEILPSSMSALIQHP